MIISIKMQNFLFSCFLATLSMARYFNFLFKSNNKLTTLISRGKAKIGFVYNNILWEWRGKRGTNLHRSQGVLHLYSLNDVD